jgi:hypothetical protein
MGMPAEILQPFGAWMMPPASEKCAAKPSFKAFCFRGKPFAKAARARLLDAGRASDARKLLTDTVVAEREYEKLVRETSQLTIKEDKAAELAEAMQRRKDITRRIIARLREGGVEIEFAGSIQEAIRTGRPFRPPVSIHFPGDRPGSEFVYRPENTRRVNFIPEISAAKHAAMQHDIMAFLDFIRPMHSRGPCMMTFNAGSRWRENGKISRLREGRRELRGALSRLFRLKAFQRFYRVYFIGEERGEPKAFTSMPACGVQREWTVHNHAHVILQPLAEIPDFNRFMQWLRLRFYSILTGVRFPSLCRLLRFEPVAARCPSYEAQVNAWLAEHCATPLLHYDRKLAHVQEACKYPFKDADIDILLTRAPAEALVDFYRGSIRARVCTPLGDFREWRRSEIYQRDGFKRKIITEKTIGGESVFRAVNDWNGQTPNMREAVEERKNRKRKLDAHKAREAVRLAAETREFRTILKARLKEWRKVQNRPDYVVPALPRNGFRVMDIQYRWLLPVDALKREIVWLFERLLSSAIIFDTAIPAFVLEHMRMHCA